MEFAYLALAIVGGYVVVGGAGLFVALRKRLPRNDLAKQLGPAYFIVEASAARIAVRVQRNDRVWEAKIALGSGESTWFLTSARPPGHTPWEAQPAREGLRDELERIMVRGRALRLSMVGGEITVAVVRGVSVVDIEECVDVAADL